MESTLVRAHVTETSAPRQLPIHLELEFGRQPYHASSSHYFSSGQQLDPEKDEYIRCLDPAARAFVRRNPGLEAAV